MMILIDSVVHNHEKRSFSLPFKINLHILSLNLPIKKWKKPIFSHIIPVFHPFHEILKLFTYDSIYPLLQTLLTLHICLHF